MKYRLLFYACCCSIIAYGQKSFEIEKLTPPKNSLTEKSRAALLQELVLKDANLESTPSNITAYQPLKKIVATGRFNDSLVNYGYHSFFDGMYAAYSDHRPFVLSPDMVWLLIVQGFSQHVNNNAEALRHLFVTHTGSQTLIVRNDSIDLDNPNSPWEHVFPAFTRQIASNTSPELVQALTSDFSTTTATSRLTSQIVIMDAMKKYFSYVVMVVGCGIPRITLEGTPADWERLLKKTQTLKKYRLDWWINELEPLLKQFAAASKGRIDKDFWRNMFKYHLDGGAYQSKAIDGWFIKFFPYDKNGKRNNLDSLKGSFNLPDEIAKVDLEYQFIDASGTVHKTPLEIWAGFWGLEQNRATFALKPQLGWIVKRKDRINALVLDHFKQQADHTIAIRVSRVPDEILQLKTINTLRMEFSGNIIIPDALKNVQIKKLILRGQIDEKEADRIRSMFPQTELNFPFIKAL